MLMIVTAMLNRSPVLHFCVNMVTAGGQHVKGLVIMGFSFTAGLGKGFILKIIYVYQLLLVKMRAKKKEPADNI